MDAIQPVRRIKPKSPEKVLGRNVETPYHACSRTSRLTVRRTVVARGNDTGGSECLSVMEGIGSLSPVLKKSRCPVGV